ncbi:hypothetical protein D3C80_2166130 [compost metagenome]
MQVLDVPKDLMHRGTDLISQSLLHLGVQVCEPPQQLTINHVLLMIVFNRMHWLE